jgi:hypothetical protein
MHFLLRIFMLSLWFSVKNVWWFFHCLFVIYFLLLGRFKLSVCLWLYYFWPNYFHIYIYAYSWIKNSFVGPTVMYAMYLRFQMDFLMSKIINMPWVQ